MYSAIQPVLKTQASKQSLLDFLRLSLLDNFYAEDLTVMTVEIIFELETSKECVKITGGEIHDVYSSEQELTIKDGDDNLLSYGDSEGNLVISPLPANNLLKFYYASELGKGSPDYDGGPGCGSNNIGQDEYEIGSLVEEQNQIIESKIFSLIGLYESGGLKTTLGISEENDFVFAFEFANGTKIEPANVVIPDTNIYATTFPVQYLDVDANLKIGYLTIKVW